MVVLDNLSKGYERAVPEGAQLVSGDLLDSEGLRRVLAAGFDGVLHFAALSLVGESVEQPERYYRNNVCGTLNLLEAMNQANARNLVFSSTAAVYGEPEEIPIPETSLPLPTNPYGSSKLAVDRLIGAVAKARGLAATSLRYFNVAGASGRAHLLAIEAAKEGEHKIYNLGNGAGFSVREVIEVARQVTGRHIEAVESPRRPGDPPVLVASSDKIRSELGWEPEKPKLEAMIFDAWNWMQAHPDGY